MNYIFLILYFVLSAIWLMLLASGNKKFSPMIDPLDKKEYPLKEFYSVGLEILDKIRYSYDTVLDKKRKAQANIVFGEQFAEYYYRINVAEKVTYVSFFVVISPLIGVLTGSPEMSLFGLFGAGLAYYYADSKIGEVVSKREDNIMFDFSDMVSKMALLINTGMITREAWDEIALSGDGVLYEEMKKATIDMQNGASEIDAYISFGNRCGIQDIKKFISMLVQNLQKGNSELADFLKAETAIVWEEKKNIVKRRGEAANNKLMLPLGLILVGVFIMILVPVVANMGL